MTQTPETALIPQAVLVALHTLSPERRQQVFDFVEFLVHKQEGSAESDSIQAPPLPAKQRILGLHKGMGWISDDFDEPLPDEFWLGTEAEGSLPA